jgi:hypothetical protein
VEEPLDEHDRAVDEQAEVERAEAHQVAGNVEHRHRRRGEGHREGNDAGDDAGRRATLPRKSEQHQHDQQTAFEQVRRDRLAAWPFTSVARS